MMSLTPFVSAILLAAGKSSRMGDVNKLLIEIDGKAVIRRSAENALKTEVNELIVVLGEDITSINRALNRINVRVVINRNYMTGMAASVVCGVRNVHPDSDAVIILLGDQPTLKPATIDRLIKKFRDTGKGIVASRFEEGVGNPVLFQSSFFPELVRLEGDTGARSLLRRFPEEMTTIDVAPEEAWDLDAPADFKKIEQFLQAGENLMECS